MPINFIVNDPLAIASVPIRTKDPLADRKKGQAGFSFIKPKPANLFTPGTEDILFW